MSKLGDEDFQLTCFGVSVILNAVHLVLVLIVSGADDGLRWLYLAGGESLTTFMELLHGFQINDRVSFGAVRQVKLAGHCADRKDGDLTAPTFFASRNFMNFQDSSSQDCI